MILSGKLAAGEKLPSTQELARLWKVDPYTVHTALAALAKEGLLSRQPRKGTLVCAREEKLTAVGIYLRHNIWQPGHSSYIQVLYQELTAELERQHLEAVPLRDPRTAWETHTLWPEMLERASRREIQGLLSLGSGAGRHVVLDKLPVPVVHFVTINSPNRVEGDIRQMHELSLDRLATQGCRTVGYISPHNPQPEPRPGQRDVGVEALTHFMEAAGRFGLTVKNQWIRTAAQDAPFLGQAWSERFGYNEFHALWSQSQRPEGLVVFDDCTARGVITAILETRVAVPEDLKLVFHRNAEVDLLCPLPASFVEYSVQAEARAAVAMLRKMYRGEAVEPVRLPYRLVTEDGRRGNT